EDVVSRLGGGRGDQQVDARWPFIEQGDFIQELEQLPALPQRLRRDGDRGVKLTRVLKLIPRLCCVAHEILRDDRLNGVERPWNQNVRRDDRCNGQVLLERERRL